MLSKITFLKEMGRLAEAFGESVADKFEKRVESYYNDLSHILEDSQFERACDWIRKNSAKFPSLKDLLEIGRTFPKQTFFKREECVVCEGSGTVVAVKENCRHLFLCPQCSNCRMNYPKWEYVFKKNGFVLDVKIKGWNERDQAQLKGLLFIGKNSLAWKNAPKEVQQAALELEKTGWKPNNYGANI